MDRIRPTLIMLMVLAACVATWSATQTDSLNYQVVSSQPNAADRFAFDVVSVTTAETELAILYCSGAADIISLEIASAPTSTGTVTDFKIYVQVHPDGSWIEYLSDFSTTSALLPWTTTGATAAPESLTAGNTAGLRFRADAAHAIKFTAATSSDTASIALRGTAAP